MVGSGAKSTKALRGLLDVSKVKLDGETLTGLDEQIKTIKTDNEYLFGEVTTVKTGQHHNQNNNPTFAAGSLEAEITNQIFGK